MGWRGAVVLHNVGTSSQLYVQGSFCSSKVLCSSGLAETQQYWVFNCQVNVKCKQFLCSGAPVMPVTPNLALFLENSSPRQGDFTKQIEPTFCWDRAVLWVLWEQLQSACLEQFSYRLMQKCRKLDMWGVCSKRGQGMRCLCVSGQECWKVSLVLTFFWGASILFHIHCSLPHPSPKKTQKCRTITPACAWLLPGHLCQAWEILLWVEHVCINSHSFGPTACPCQTILHLSLPCVRRAPFELN